MNIKIIRKPDQSVETMGYMAADCFKCKTLELAWNDNKKKVSCIPVGAYKWEKVPASTNIPYPHIAIKNVPNRDGICIHSANYAAGKTTQLLGCIAVGSGYSDINKDGYLDIIESKKTFEKLMSVLPNSGKLIIENEENLLT